MLNTLRSIGMMILMALLSISLIAQSTDCPALVQNALDAIDETCAETGRNQACYGNTLIDLEPQADAEIGSFSIPGDTVALNDVAMMTLAPLDEASETWGVALMKLQASIPDTLPGQNVTFLLFGDIVIENAATDDSGFTPMQAFYFTSGIGDAGCEEAPESGLLIQTPDGVEEVLLNVNGANMSLGSTAFLQAGPREDSDDDFELTISVLEGEGTIESYGELQPIPAGSWVRLPVDRNFNVISAPDVPRPYDNERHNRLPIEGLDRQFEPQQRLTQEQINQRMEEFNSDNARRRLQNMGATLNEQRVRERNFERDNRLVPQTDNSESQQDPPSEQPTANEDTSNSRPVVRPTQEGEKPRR